MRKLKACPLFGRCGGCDYSIEYAMELEEKTEYVHSLFSRYCPTYETIGGAKDGYRNKVVASFAYDRKGHVISGLYIKGTHRIIEKRDCPLEFEGSAEILRSIRRLMKSYAVKPYDEDTYRGDLRHVLLRKGHKSGEVLVLLVFGNDRYGRKKEFAHSIMDICPSVVSVFYQVNNEKTSMILSSSPIKFLAGQRFIKSRLFNLTFRVGPSSFFQVNDGQTEVLYDMALYMAGLSGKEKVLDAYSGTGTIAMIAAKKACSVTAVENNKEAVAFAVKSAEENNIGNVTFITEDASSFIKAEAKRKEHYDVVFLDPPRAGSDERFLSSLIKLSPGKIIYISCNPETQVRDIRYLEKFGPYRVRAVQPVDMFPRTQHVETIVLLQRETL